MGSDRAPEWYEAVSSALIGFSSAAAVGGGYQAIVLDRMWNERAPVTREMVAKDVLDALTVVNGWHRMIHGNRTPYPAYSTMIEEPDSEDDGTWSLVFRSCNDSIIRLHVSDEQVDIEAIIPNRETIPLVNRPHGWGPQVDVIWQRVMLLITTFGNPEMLFEDGKTIASFVVWRKSQLQSDGSWGEV